MRFKDIPQLTQDANYRVNVPWDYLEDWLIKDKDDISPDLDPPFQRAHVWTEKQQISYVEFALRGGKGSNEVRFNCAGWMSSFKGPFVLVDGKQRLQAVRRFLANEIGVFGGHLYEEFEDRMRIAGVDFIMMVNSLPDMKSVLNWYLEINAGGIAHTKDELDKVRKMLLQEVGER